MPFNISRRMAIIMMKCDKKRRKHLQLCKRIKHPPPNEWMNEKLERALWCDSHSVCCWLTINNLCACVCVWVCEFHFYHVIVSISMVMTNVYVCVRRARARGPNTRTRFQAFRDFVRINFGSLVFYVFLPGSICSVFAASNLNPSQWKWVEKITQNAIAAALAIPRCCRHLHNEIAEWLVNS